MAGMQTHMTEEINLKRHGGVLDLGQGRLEVRSSMGIHFLRDDIPNLVLEAQDVLQGLRGTHGARQAPCRQ